jgi:hypothetical protein
MIIYLSFTALLVGSQHQTNAIYVDHSSASDLDSNTLFLHKLSGFVLPGGYVKWFHSYLTKQESQVHVSGILSSPSEVFFSMYLMTYVTTLLYILLMTSKSTPPLCPLKTAIYKGSSKSFHSFYFTTPFY